ncbi:unnamed protein product (macronuclear) [Paramecium tetraurelia]|uniref:RING-type domain-containing protein n=1 Tax=Paramecium tetraurelia TaxID=5888 RepID=A0CC15_PARTE|nr:uncharacterized protein GSPATT00037116001 [Paramecium tetraurelia]CAK68332.1 unnamed protein product [Paramecium tetraurelia]|eukprot:XP_001435729.1 hypothetical protein (macronuclear) [Paramecium tetraurelia strain d4-2]
MQSYQEAPFFENNTSKKKIRYENADIYGKQQQKKYHYIVLDQENSTEFSQYLVIMTNQTTQYKLVIKNLSEMPCPNNCSNNGICRNGVCICNPGYLDHDCSEEGLRITPFVQFQQQKNSATVKYICICFNYTLGFNMLIKFSQQWENVSDVRVQILISQKFNLPSDYNNTYDEIINTTKIGKYKVLSNVNPLDIEQVSISNQSYSLLIKIISKNLVQCCISIDFQGLEYQEEEKMLKLLVILGLIGFFLLIFGIIVYYCYKPKSTKSNLEGLYQLANQEDLQKFPECPICLENFEINKLALLARLECQHIFHIQCLSMWKTHQNKKTPYSICPCCRKAIV